MATVPTGYIFRDVSAGKTYEAGKTFPTLGNGDWLAPATSSYDGYYQCYIYETSHTEGNVTFTDCWYGYVQAEYTSKAQRLPYNAIAGKPVRFFRYNNCQFTACPTTTNSGGSSTLSAITNLRWVSFLGCTKLASAPALPTGLTSLYTSFYDCTKLASANISNLTSVHNADYCFNGCTSLTNVSTMSNLSALQSAIGMFYGCTALVNPPALPTNIADVGYMFRGCTHLASGPDIPSQVFSIYGMFWGCTALSGIIKIDATNITSYSYAFYNTSSANQIILLGSASIFSKLKQIAKTGNNGNVFAGIVAKPISFTSIRGTYDSQNQTFTEVSNGLYCKLTVTYNAPYVSGALLLPPTLTGDGDTLTPTWHISSVDGTELTSAGTQIQSSGTLIAVLYLGSSETAVSFESIMNTSYIYNSVEYEWSSGTIQTTLTHSELIIDINPTGTGICFFGEAPDDYSGMIVDKGLTAEELYIKIDMDVLSGDDHDIRQALTDLVWTDCLVN